MEASLNLRSYSCKAVTQLPLRSPNSFCMKRDLTSGCGTTTFVQFLSMYGLNCFTALNTA